MKYLLISVIIFLAIGCQKEITDPIVSTPVGVVSSDSILLKLFVKLDTLHPPSFDTLNKLEFAYDASKRISDFTYTVYDSVTGHLVQIIKVNFTYNGSDTLPAQALFSEIMMPSILCTYKYDALQRPVYKKELGQILSIPFSVPVDSLVSTIQYNGGDQITQIGNYKNGTLLYIDTLLEHTQLPAINVTYKSTLPFVDTFKYNYSLQYDSYHNPFKRLAIIFELFPIKFGEYSDSYLGGDFDYSKIMSASDNNLVAYNLLSFPNTPHSYTDYFQASYTYNSLGYPISAKYRMSEFGVRNYSGKKLYFYTN